MVLGVLTKLSSTFCLGVGILPEPEPKYQNTRMGIDLGEIGYSKITVRAAAVRLEPSRRGLGCPNQVKLNVLPRGEHFTRTRTEITKYPNGY